MRVDTTAPTVKVTAAAPQTFSPDGDGRADRVVVHYKLSERGHAILLVDGTRVTFTRSSQPAGTVSWNGKIDGRRQPPGTYVLSLQAQDPAGNVSTPVKASEVRLRYVELARPVVRAKARTRFGVGVAADGTVRWTLHGKHGTAKPGLLVLKAPKAGRYPLVVAVGPHEARAVVIVSKR
jgi:hypothetical protein